MNALLAAYEDAGRPLSPEKVDDLQEVSEDLRNSDLSPEWVWLELVCRVCGHQQVALAPAVSDLDNMECGHCENMTCQEIDELEWWQEDQ